MKRAAILIGVDKTGDLPRLRDAARGARLMQAWAESQGMKTTVITDEQGPVTIDSIKRPIRELVDAANVSQLLVYFAGHGVNLQRQEYWLLTDAPDDSQAAVNVFTSVTWAATCGIPHIVVVSDACRTAPEGIRAQSLRGSEIFPNREADTNPVDQFFACQLGKPSHEVKDPSVSSSEFKALYTNELVRALLGECHEVITWSGDGAAKVGRVEMRPLRDFVRSAVARKIAELGLQTRITQVPIAQISSDPPAWISEIPETAATGGNLAAALPSFPNLGSTCGLDRREPTPGFDIASDRLAALVSGVLTGQGTLEAITTSRQFSLEAIMAELNERTLDQNVLRALSALPAPIGNSLPEGSLRLAEPFGPIHHETACGFKLRGARVVEWASHGVQVDIVGGGSAPGQDLRVHTRERPCSNVLLVLESGAGVLLPAIPDFLCALTFDEDELVDVAYEPSANTYRWHEYERRSHEIRALRAVVASATAQGSFKLETEQAQAIARHMQINKGVDPALALYAAYAYHDLQRRDLLREMVHYLQADLGGAFLDVLLAARALDRKTLTRDEPRLLGAVPLLAQGWSLLRAFQVRLSPGLASLETELLPSLWTMFGPKGVDLVRSALETGEIR